MFRPNVAIIRFFIRKYGGSALQDWYGYVTMVRDLSICDVRYPGVCSSSMYARCYPMWLILESLTPGLRFSNSRLFCEFVPIVRRNLCATAVHPSYRLHSTTVSIPSRFYRQQQQLDTLNLTEIVYETCIQMQRSQEKM